MREHYLSQDKKRICYEIRTLNDKIVTYEYRLIDYKPVTLNSIIPLRLYPLKELESLLKETKFELLDVFGDYKGNPYSIDSPNLITVSKKIIKEESQ